MISKIKPINKISDIKNVEGEVMQILNKVKSQDYKRIPLTH